MNNFSNNLNFQKMLGINNNDAKKLAQLGLNTIVNLLYYFPREYLSFRRTRISEARTGEYVTIAGKIVNHVIFDCRKKPKLTLQKWIVRDKTGKISCTQFHHHSYYRSHKWRVEQYELYSPGTLVLVTGKVKQDSYGLTINNPSIKVVSLADAKASTNSITPIYRLTKGVTNELIQHCTRIAIAHTQGWLDPLPTKLRFRFELVDLVTALAQIHFPPNNDSLEKARRRLAFDEFFYLQLGLLQRRYSLQQQPAYPLIATRKLLNQFYQKLPFTLTQAQQRVINEILSDMEQLLPMNRLVQGDVGAGKTVVAAVAMLAAIQSGYQVALMAPTEVLAQQHFGKISAWIEPLGISLALLTGSTSNLKRRSILQELESGKLSLLVGTHALIQDTVHFNQLGLVVIDEQHRFGVEQRIKLSQKGITPHLLTMTATPIPRTLALTLHGDLDVSQIDELPPGRQPIETKLLTERTRDKAYRLIDREVERGRQAYIILPLVEASAKLDLKAAIDEYQHLSENVFPNYKVGLLHGRMNSAQKETALTRFLNHQTQILVSTTVVEVGVDVPNASVMLIEHAERFGLSQLHQLRGRVGRGSHKSYCLLVSNSKSEDAKTRLKVMETCQDGFFLAQMDLRLRGPGQVLGTKQAGLPNFALADLSKDQVLLEQAREAALLAIGKDPTLKRWPELLQEMSRRQPFEQLSIKVALN
ncbi:MAG: ATP-dependent DNA helicase RecG [Phormidium sp.]